MAFIDGKWRQGLHLEPPQGWLNDPNGLSFFGGYYHVYFQYSPESAAGNGKKCWGHYQSSNLTNWEFTGTVLFPDIPEDRNGVYSGSAIVHQDTLHIFYTGNVKEPGDHDYIKSGRGANVIHVSTKDGIHMSPKKVLLRNSDYPSFCSCHVRDPKIWVEDGKWKMVLGARSLDDKGCVLFYESADLENWIYAGCDSIEEFGYMWECPDCFWLDGHRYLGASPQGLPHGETENQNVYQSGYFEYDKKAENFREWDMGFDFYAPQTFETEDGRRILIGWMGIGDIPYTNPTAELGYQHCLTLPRELTRDADGRLRQEPIHELNALRKNVTVLGKKKQELPFELNASTEGPFSICLDKAVKLSYDGEIFSLTFLEEKVGAGRKVRRAKLSECSEIRLIADKSSLEIYLDKGSVVLSSRMYPAGEMVEVEAEGISPIIYPLSDMEVSYLGE